MTRSVIPLKRFVKRSPQNERDANNFARRSIRTARVVASCENADRFDAPRSIFKRLLSLKAERRRVDANQRLLSANDRRNGFFRRVAQQETKATE